MKTEIMIAFVQDLYSDQTGQSVQFESRLKYNGKLNQIVSSLMSEEGAQSVCDSLKHLLPQCANVKVCGSNQVKGQFRAVIFNPGEIFSVYAEKMAGLLNKHHPFPEILRPVLERDYRWTVLDGESMTIGYKAEVSLKYMILSGPSEDEDQQQNALKGYNQLMESTYPGISFQSMAHKHGDDFLLDAFTYSDFKNLMAKNQVPSLRAIGINFFQKNPQHLTEEAQTSLPQDLVDEIKENILPAECIEDMEENISPARQ